jgi:outer membrane protein OmpA-like peptidoglycan-associated protein/tetratricopeptide (TPR) repeat protein
MKCTTSILLIFLSVIFGYAQEKQMQQANDLFDKYAFIEAQQQYLELIQKGYKSAELYGKLGDTYYFNNDYKNAQRWYNQLFRYDASGIDKEYYFKYILTLKAVKNYEKASEVVKLYQNKHIDDLTFIEFLEEMNDLEKIELQSNRYIIKNEFINTGAQDFGTSFYHGTQQVVFASSKDSSSFTSRRHKWNERQFLDLYTAQIDTTTWSLSNVGLLGGQDHISLNSIFHESNAVFTKDGQTVYYTSNNYFEKRYQKSVDGINRLKIFKATKTAKGWGEIVDLSINSNEFSTAHPALNPDETRLYFASDRPGSTAGITGQLLSDIWYVDINKNGTLSEPVNARSINTVGNELFPFISNSGDLYFSSTGHYGLGGMDVFVIPLDVIDQQEKLTVTNIGKPVNSPHDDFAFIINDTSLMGYFSSNRPGGKGLDDIYSFKQMQPLVCKVAIDGIVTDKVTSALLPGATIELRDANHNIIETTVIDESATYSFDVNCNTNYRVTAVKEGFDNYKTAIKAPSFNTTVNVPLTLSKITSTKVYDIAIGADLNKILDLEPIYFDLDKYNIRVDAAIELKKILTYMEAFPDVFLEIRAHTDSRATNAYNDRLSANRAAATKAYLVNNGIAASRLTATGYGETRLTNECTNAVKCTEEQHQLNRRSEFIVVKK